MLSRDSSNGWGISWYYSSVSVSGQMSNRGDWSSSGDVDSWVCFAFSFTLTNEMCSICVSGISYLGNCDILENWSSFDSKMLSGCCSNGWGISWDLSSVSVSGKSTNSNNRSSSENMDCCVGITFRCWSSRGYSQEGKE